MDVQWLLDEAKRKGAIPSDNQLALKLGVSRQAVSYWRRGGALPDVVSCEKLADLCGFRPLRVVASINEQRATTAEEKRLWKRLGAVALLLMMTTFPAVASTKYPTNGQAFCTLCEVLARIRRDVARHFATLTRRIGGRHAPLPAL